MEKPWYKALMKAYVAIADSDGLRSFLPERDVPDGLMILEAKAAQGRGWACFWAAVDERTADQIGEELACGQRRDAMNLFWVLARDIVRYPIGSTSHEMDSSYALRSGPLKPESGSVALFEPSHNEFVSEP